MTERRPDQELIDATNSHIDRATGVLDRLLPFSSWRPLDRVPSIKLKLSILIVAAIGITVGLQVIGWSFGISTRITLVPSVLIALGLVHILARGITAPLRDMARAADAFAAGDLEQRVAATANDEVGQLARSFNAMAADIADLERQRRDLIANVSHELRTPISVIQGNLENLVDGVVQADEQTLLTMLRQTRRLSLMVAQLMDLSRIEAGAAPLRVCSMDLVDIAEQAAAEARMSTPEPKIELVAPSQVLIQGDPDRLHQVFLNLLNNAVRYSDPDDPIKLIIELGTDEITTTVQDCGEGIPDFELEHIFERFHRADSDRSTAHGGTGLGLAICRGIVELHNGTISAANGEPCGAVITVKLPLPLTV
jgi:signal transduction histidine kinase